MKKPTPLEGASAGTVGVISTPNIVPINAFAKDRVGPHSRSRACPNPHRTRRHLAADRRGRARGRTQAAKSAPRDPRQVPDCSCYQVSEVRLCEAVKCPLWPFRAGKHPWWGEGEKTCQTLANSERQTAFQDEGLPSC